MACGRSYFIADTTVRIRSATCTDPTSLKISIKIDQETITDTTTLCNSMNMTVLTLETLAELFCLLNMIPIGEIF
jgi:hypothetical protein